MRVHDILEQAVEKMNRYSRILKFSGNNYFGKSSGSVQFSKELNETGKFTGQSSNMMATKRRLLTLPDLSTAFKALTSWSRRVKTEAIFRQQGPISLLLRLFYGAWIEMSFKLISLLELLGKGL